MPNAPRPDNPARPVRIENTLWSEVQTIAATDDTYPSEVVREAVRRYVAYRKRKDRNRIPRDGEKKQT